MAKLIKALGRYYNGVVIREFLKSKSNQLVAQKLITDPEVKKIYIDTIMNDLRKHCQPVISRVNRIVTLLDNYGGASFKTPDGNQYLVVAGSPYQDIGIWIRYGLHHLFKPGFNQVTDVKYHKDCSSLTEVPPFRHIVIVDDEKMMKVMIDRMRKKIQFS